MLAFITGICVGFALGVGTVVVLMVFHFDPKEKWDEPWGPSQTED